MIRVNHQRGEGFSIEINGKVIAGFKNTSYGAAEETCWFLHYHNCVFEVPKEFVNSLRNTKNDG